MSFRPGLANMASVLADPAREAILVALADGRALPAGELAEAAGVSPQSASRHLHKLVEGHLLEVWTQGRFRYYRIASDEIAGLLEDICALAGRVEQKKLCRARATKVPQNLCDARRCYGHLAGRLGVELADALVRLDYVSVDARGREAAITASGAGWMEKIGIELPDQRTMRLCMDWTERRPHFAGPAATAMLRFFEKQKLLVPDPAERRALRPTLSGRKWLASLGIPADARASAA
jgi:DNA-binding transcriptional ArsR family regulator